MRFKTKGIVLREMPKGETSKLLTVLTADMGVITVNAKGVKKLSSPYLKSAQLFALSDMLIYEKNGFYTLTEASLITDFYSIAKDICNYALACYLCEAASAFAVQGEDSSVILRLLLNCLYALENNISTRPIVKSAFELRLCMECGFNPSLQFCSGCDDDLGEANYIFDVSEGESYCITCGRERHNSVLVTPTVRDALFHITESELSRILSFRIGEESQKLLAALTERYFLNCAERGFKTLSFYKQCEENQ